ncbi:MAG: hypothetical protein WKF34_02540 [Pyrinomonadaceae bacterium]
MQQEERKQDDHITGSDLPKGDGGVGDEQVNAIDDDRKGKPTGQDHSAETDDRREPADGVGGVQDSSDTTSDVARISD